MLRIADTHVRLCEGVTRREWLCVGGLSSFGLLLPQLLAARAEAAGTRPHTFGRAKSCILCFLFGAPAHQDIWDLKPEAPSDVRGEFRPIPSSVPGIWLGEHIPQVAAAADRLTIVRSVTHPDNTHTIAMHYMLTGVRHLRPDTNPRNQATDFPCFGAVLQYLRSRQGALPAGISLNAPANQVSANNHIFPGFFAGVLGSSYDPLFISQDPSAAEFEPFPVAKGDEIARFKRRRGLLARLDGSRYSLEGRTIGLKAYYERALDLLTSSAARRAFELHREPETLRDRYGRSPFGQGLLLARRLVEAGVPLITVNWARGDAFWDTHSDNFRLLKTSLLPPFDRAFSALIEDLDQRGLLQETLVVCLGEFGRTPKINAAAGRDHWAACNSVVLAGAGVARGRVVGASDRLAAYPADLPITPEDLAATIYHTLGIDPTTELYDREQRPLQLSHGRVLNEIFG